MTNERETVAMVERVGWERLLFAWTLATGLCLLQTTVLATVLGLAGPAHPATPFIATLVVTSSALALARYGSRAAFVSGTPGVAALVGVALGWPRQAPEMLVTSLAAAFTCVAVVRVAASRLPSWMDGRLNGRLSAHRIPWWIAAAFSVLFVVQLARVGVYVHDSSMKRAAAVPSASAHSCLPAYLRGAELALAGVDNLYLASHYVEADTSVAGMRPHMRDPFVYPPPALLAPALALRLSRSFPLLNALWFALQTVMVFAAAFALAGRLAPRARALGAWLVLPLVVSLPMLTALQYGQVHVVTLCASVAAMLAFRKDWLAVGGALLALAISFKLFPALLLVYLAARGRWRAVVSTAVACASYLLLTWLWFGPQPLAAFAHYQLPRLASGEAFGTFLEQPSFDTVHMSVPGAAISLSQLGLDPGAEVGKALGWLYGLGVLAVAWTLGRRGDTPVAWLAVICLASTAGLYAPAAYTAAGTLWLLAALLALTWQRPVLPWVVAGAGVALQLAPFAGALPGFRTLPGIAILASLTCTALGLAVHLAPVLFRRQSGPFSPAIAVSTPPPPMAPAT